MVEKETIRKIREAVRAWDIKRAFFRAREVYNVCKTTPLSTCRAFLPKHCIGNGYTTELFERVDKGLYRLLGP